MTVAVASGIAAALVRRLSPYAAGSGIPHVEAVAKGELPPASFMLVPVKFIGGVLAIGSGLALGREGPSVQMGAGIGVFIGKKVGLPDSESIALLAACAGAGIATAFNAPIAGAVFVLEELIRRFDTRTTVAALGCSCCAIAVSRMVLGSAPDFQVPVSSYAPFATGMFFLTLGAFAGLLGSAYNRAILTGISLADRLHWPIELRAASIGAIVGAIAWFAPDLVGGGDTITQRTLIGDVNRSLLPFLLCLRFLLGPFSYAAGTPGGLFAPMLTIGAQAGLLFATVCSLLVPNLHLSVASCAVVGMAAFFTAVVRAPVTGIVLVMELTAGFTQLMPMLWACFAAMVVPILLGVEPIYESLRQPAMQSERSGTPATEGLPASKDL
jgi:CIC family chloride channel protein